MNVFHHQQQRWLAAGDEHLTQEGENPRLAGVVLVRNRYTEEGHEAVGPVLDDAAPIAFHRRLDAGEECLHEMMHRLGTEPGRQRCRLGEDTAQNGDLLMLLIQGG